jgi:hypothetical protein
VELSRCHHFLPCYNFAAYARKTNELRARDVDDINLLIGNPDLPTLLRRMSLVQLIGAGYILFK